MQVPNSTEFNIVSPTESLQEVSKVTTCICLSISDGVHFPTHVHGTIRAEFWLKYTLLKELHVFFAPCILSARSIGDVTKQNFEVNLNLSTFELFAQLHSLTSSTIATLGTCSLGFVAGKYWPLIGWNKVTDKLWRHREYCLCVEIWAGMHSCQTSIRNISKEWLIDYY